MKAVRLAAAATALLVLTACTPDEPDYVKPSGGTTTATDTWSPRPVEGDTAGPLGAKWDWSRFDGFEAYVRSLAGGSTFYELVWCQVERTPGDRNWKTIDRIASRAQQAGVHLMLKIRVGQCWATASDAKFVRGNKNKTESGVPRSNAEYADFVTEAVDRYKDRGVKVWAVENEVNSPSFWAGTPEQYEALVGLASRTVKAADPEAEVVDAGLSSTSYGVGIATRLLDEGRDDAAVAAWNSYYSRRFDTRGDELQRVSTGAELRAVLDGDQQRRNAAYLDVTERVLRSGEVDARQVHFYEDADAASLFVDYLRATTPDDLPVEVWEAGSFVRGGELPDEEQLTDLVEKVSLFLGAGMRRVIWLPLIPSTSGRNADEPRSGLLSPDTSVRPLGKVFVEMAADARGADATSVEHGDRHGVALTRDGVTVAWVWSSAGALDLGPGVDAQTLDGGSASTVGRTPVRLSVQGTPDDLWKKAQ